MFGKNEIVGKKWFNDKKEAQDGKIFVTSRFYTLQGEGPFAGMPAIFIRLAKCNLACSFCDTFFDDGDWYSIDGLSYVAGSMVPYGLTKKDVGIVLTGGEPLLQENLTQLCKRFVYDGYRFTQIESNGIIPRELPDSTVLVISPKCVEKDGVSIKYIQPHKKNLERADCLKFVMSAPTEKYSPYSEIPDWALDWKQETGKDIYVSPMNIYNEEPQKSKEARAFKNRLEIEERSTVDEVISFWDEGLLDLKENQVNHEYTAKYCLEHGLRLNLQMHLYCSLS